MGNDSGKVLVVYSGGLDSTVLLHKLAAQSRVAGAIGFLYGQRHSKELDFAQKNCSKLNIDFYLADISALSPMFGNNSLTDRNVEVPEGRYYESNMIAVGAQAVAYAAHSGDHAIYPDCRPEFTEAMERALALCHYYPIGLERPFVGMTKADIVRLGADLGVDFSLTWSCYKGGEKHCGKCGTCVERREAFKLAGVPDPTEYLG